MRESQIGKKTNTVIFFLLIIFPVSLLVSRELSPVAGMSLLLVTAIFLIAPIMPTEYPVQRAAFASVLLIGLSPFYLVIRGFFTRSYLNNWDFQIYIFLFVSIAMLVAGFTVKKDRLKVYHFRLKSSLLILPSLLGLVVVYVVELMLGKRSIGDAVAWIASGDSKNHLVNGVEITQYGFLDPSTFLTQPVSSPTFLSMVLSQGGSSFATDALTLTYQMQVYAFVWAVLIGILGVTFAAMSEVIWSKFSPENPSTPVTLIMISSLVPLFSFIVGPALFDGFFTAIFGISTVVTFTVWFIGSFDRQKFSKVFIFVGILLFASTLMSWMFISILTLPMLGIGIRSQLRIIFTKHVLIDFLIAIFSVAFVGAIHLSEFGQSFIYQAKLALTANGAVTTSNPNLYIASLAALGLISVVMGPQKVNFKKVMLAIAVIHLVSLLFFKNFSNLGVLSWNYYLLKYQWILFSGLISIFVSLLFVKMYLATAKNNPLKTLTVLVALSIVFLISESVVSTNKIWQKIWSGWENPRSSILNVALEQQIDYKNPTMFFHYGYGGDATLANFWMNAFANPVEPIKGWNYTIDTLGNPQQLCDVNAYYPTLNVITQDPNLEIELSKICPNENFNIKVE